MKNATLLPVAIILGIALAPVGTPAQSRQDIQQMQVLEDLRMLQEQVQSLRSAIAALAEQTKATNTRLDLQAEVIRTNHANESATLGTVQAQVDTFAEKMNQYALQVNRFGAEIPSLRAGLDQQQKTLDKLLSLLVVAPPTSPSNASAGAPAAPGTPLPASPAAAFTQAKGVYFGGDFELALKALEDFMQKFPDASAYLGEAEYLIGMSQYNRAKYPAAGTAFQAVIDTYKTSDKVPDAYYQLGECYRVQGKRTEAGAAWDQVIKLFPDSSAALQAKQAKIRLAMK